ncbi:cell division protein SepF [Methanobrevibacter sp.]|uniref:cell division protein SepF n=1 Tax=Methanobrevibacter sp. TaxID=66852 RepID=UPI0025CEBAD8|nr:cell division protein SepF [Methanobrevibacter sp.]
MSFMDTLKRSLGFEETNTSNDKTNDESSFYEILDELTNDVKAGVSNLRGMIQQDDSQSSRPTQNPNPTYNTNPTFNPNPTQSSEQMPRPTPIQDDYDDYVITPEQSYYEIVLIRPKSIDDVNYVIDQIVEERNPVILDLSFLEKDSPANFKLAGEKIKQMRAKYGAQALLLARSEEKNLIIISPNKVRLINKS